MTAFAVAVVDDGAGDDRDFDFNLTLYETAVILFRHWRFHLSG